MATSDSDTATTGASATDQTFSVTATGTVTDTSGGHRASERIVVGVDGSDSSLLALRWALAEGSLRGVPVHAVLTWTLPQVVGMSSVTLPDVSDLQDAAREQLDTILLDEAGKPGDWPANSPVTSAVLQAGPAAALLEAAEDASLLVVGTRGHGGFAGLLLGSVSQQCAAHASCPVVVVHAGGQHRAH